MLARVEALLELVGRDAGALRRLALRFVISDPRISVAVSGMSRISEVEENAAAIEAGPLSRRERERIDEALATVAGSQPKWH
jgi:L-glyceraldehyde 3-phosphate reductase